MANTINYRIYGKDGTMKRKRAVDMSTGSFVSNLIFASVYTDLDIVNKKVEEINKMNEDMTFEVRKV